MSRRSPLLTVKEVARYLVLSEKTVYRLANTGKLPAVKVGGQWRFEPERLDNWLGNKINRAFGK